MSTTIKVWRYWVIRSKALFLLSQFALLTAVLTFVTWDRVVHSQLAILRNEPAWIGLLLLLLSPQLCCYFNGLHTTIAAPRFSVFFDKALGSLLIGALMPVPLFLIFPNLFPGYLGAVTAFSLSAILVFGLRPLLQWMIRHKRFVEGLLVLGTGDQARKFYRELTPCFNSEANSPPDSSDCFSHNHGDCPEPFEDFGETIVSNELPQVTLRDRIQRIVVTEPGAQNSEDLAIALLDCKLRGLQVEQAVESYEKLNNKVWLEGLRPEWLVYSSGFTPSKFYLVFKACFDTLCALLLLILAAPLLLVISILILITSGSPILFRQVRVGHHGKRFVLLKFRTMRQDAEQATGPVWATTSDQRVTAVGNYLRKFRLDELPQLFNVLQGNMSLIGPRPERPYFVELLNRHIHYYELRHSVKPGITGWAQVLYPYGASIEDAYEKLQYDLYYAKHMSLGLELKIVFGTLKVVFFGRGR